MVLIVVAIGLACVAWSWVTYHSSNPTTSEATLSFSEPNTWMVQARFPNTPTDHLLPGTLAIVTTPNLPNHKMSGQITRVMDAGWYEISITTTPPEGTPPAHMPCFVTVDAATAPVQK